MKDPLKKYIQDHREEFDTQEAPSEMFDKIMTRLDSSTPSVEKKRSIVSWSIWAIAASVAVIAGLGTFNSWQEKEVDKDILAAKQTSKKADERPVDTLNHKEGLETSKTETEIHKITKIVFVRHGSDHTGQSTEIQNFIPNNNIEDKNDPEIVNAMTLVHNKFSASSRLQGIALLKDLAGHDAKIIDVLSEMAISDESTNVRLAAVSALEAQKIDPAVINRIQQIFVQQNDPMVQKELISFLSEKQPSGLSAEVNKRLLALAQDPATLDFVKDEAYAVIMRH